MVDIQIPDEDQVVDYVQSVSNWGRWGQDDELGTINHIGPEQRKKAAALVLDGVAVSCARPITTETAPDTGSPPLHYMTNSGEGYAISDEVLPQPGQGSGDFIGMRFHGYSITHLDSLCHIFWNGRMYNGRPSSMVTTRDGATVNSIEAVQDGVVGRGVLLDAARHRGVDWMQPGEAIMPDELNRIATDQGTMLQQGDILMVRTGHYQRRRKEGPRPLAEGWPGLHATCIPWLQEHNVAVLGGDINSEVAPSGYPNIREPIHQIALPYMGLWLMDNCNLEELSEACAERNRWEFLLTIAPLRIRYGTGSPVNPIAMF
jgi:kynurenine formamidase